MILSKADRIRAIMHLPDAEIAERVNCHEAYVRAVRQRTSRDGFPIETEAGRMWKERNWRRVQRYNRTTKQRYRQWRRETFA